MTCSLSCSHRTGVVSNFFQTSPVTQFRALRVGTFGRDLETAAQCFGHWASSSMTAGHIKGSGFRVVAAADDNADDADDDATGNGTVQRKPVNCDEARHTIEAGMPTHLQQD